MEAAPLTSNHEADSQQSPEKKAKKPHRRNPEALGAAATHAPELPKPERVGHMLLEAESRAESIAEPAEQPASKRVETLSRVELLAYSDKIEINGSSLRQIYETHLIGERGLRRLVAESLRGGDLGKALEREILEREIDFERDPAMRDIAIPTDSASTGTTTSNTALSQLLEQADAETSCG